MYRPLLYLLFCCCVIAARPLHAGVITIDMNGLPDKFITAISKDRQGLMWIGTHQGLYTYDGYDFLPLNTSVLNALSILKLAYDTEHDLLWAATETGLYSVACHSRTMTPAGKEAWCRNKVTGLSVTNTGDVYASFKSGEIAWTDAGGELSVITRISNAVPDLKGMTRAEKKGNSVLVVQAGKSRYRLQVHNGRLQHSDVAQVPSWIITIKGDTLVTWNHGAQVFRGDTDITPATMDHIPAVDLMTTARFISDSVFYFLGRPSELSFVHIGTGRVTQINAEAFVGKLSTSVFIDEDRLIWVGTNKGLLKIVPDKTFFEQALVASPTISVRPLAQDEAGNMYAGSYSGLFKRAAGSHTWQHISGDMPYALVNMPGSYLYFAGDRQALLRLHKKTGIVESDFYRIGGSDSSWQQTYSILPDGQGLWIGGLHSLKYYDPVKNLLSTYQKISWPDPGTEIRCIRPAGKDELWLCTNKGLYLLHKQKGIVWHINTQTSPALSLNIVNYISEDRHGHLWICTAGGGINILSRDRRSITLLRTKDGLSDNNTYHLLWDKSGRAWIGTYNGLSTYDPRTKIFRNYYTTDGLSNNEFNHNSSFQDSLGTMYFGTISGLNSFRPDSLQQAIRPGLLFASTITKWDNATHAVAFIPATDTARTIVLRPLDHSLSFSLAMTDYAHPENNLYLYRIQGLFNEWTLLKSRHILQLDGLAPGNYLVEIKALDSRGVPSGNILHYKIAVRQTFYKAWWFYLLLFILASGLIWSFFYLRLRHLRRMQVLRGQIASDLHDEVGSLLTRITMTSDSLLYRRSPDQPTATGLQKIAALSRAAVSSMSDVLWTIDARNDYTGNLADRMREHAEEMLLPLHAELHFDFTVAPKMSLASGVRQQLYFIFKEAINNIVKHSHPTQVTVSYRHNEKGFELLIRNNGVIDKQARTGRLGLKNIAMRARRIHATAEIASEKDDFSIHITGK